MLAISDPIPATKPRAAYLDKVDLVEGLVTPGLLNVEDRDDVFMVEVPQKLHLSQSPETEHGVVERRDLLDCDLLAGRFVDGRAGTRHGSGLDEAPRHKEELSDATYQTTP